MNIDNPFNNAGSVNDLITLVSESQKSMTATGRTSHVVTTKGDQVKTAFKVVDASSLIISNNLDGTINPDFPTELQPRDRTRLASRLQVQKIAGSLRPAQLGDSGLSSQGAPIVGSDHVVESGNGRSMGILRAYQQGQAEDYRQFLIDNAVNYGLSADDVASMKQPILVRERQTDVDRAQFAKDSNLSDLQEMSASEKAYSDAQFLTDNTMAMFQPGDDGNLLSKSNMPFIQAFLREIGDTASAGLLTADGRPTKQLIDRLQNAIFAKAYKDDRLVKLVSEEPDPDMRNILTALNVAAGEFAQMSISSGDTHKETVSGLVDGIEDVDGLDKQAIAALQDAINMVRDAKDNGQAIEEVIAQQGLFQETSKEAEALAMFIVSNNRSAKRMGAAFNMLASKINDEIIHQQQAIGDMFGGVPVDLKSILTDVSAQIEAEYGEGKGINFAMFESSPIKKSSPFFYCQNVKDLTFAVESLTNGNKVTAEILTGIQKAALSGVRIERMVWELRQVAKITPDYISWDSVKQFCIRWFENAYPLPSKIKGGITKSLDKKLSATNDMQGVIAAVQQAVSGQKKKMRDVSSVITAGAEIAAKAGVTKDISSTVIADGYIQSLQDLKTLADKAGNHSLSERADFYIQQINIVRDNPEKLTPYIKEVFTTNHGIAADVKRLGFAIEKGNYSDADMALHDSILTAFNNRGTLPDPLSAAIHKNVKAAFDSLFESSPVTPDQAKKWASEITLSGGTDEPGSALFDIPAALSGAYSLAGGKVTSLSKIDSEDGVRAYASKSGGNIVIDKKYDKEAVMWHEVGHHIEFSNPHLLDRAKGFLKMKGGNRLTYFNTGSRGNAEYILRAGMSRNYMSRIYMPGKVSLESGRMLSGAPSLMNCISTEIFSMGLQMYKDPEMAAKSVINGDGLLEFFLGCMKELQNAD